jgi:hypothetical protein
MHCNHPMDPPIALIHWKSYASVSELRPEIRLQHLKSKELSQNQSRLNDVETSLVL